jgi:hypothetical protein
MKEFMKYVIIIVLLIPYLCTLGMVTFGVKFPDDTSFCYDGWFI